MYYFSLFSLSKGRRKEAEEALEKLDIDIKVLETMDEGMKKQNFDENQNTKKISVLGDIYKNEKLSDIDENQNDKKFTIFDEKTHSFVKSNCDEVQKSELVPYSSKYESTFDQIKKAENFKPLLGGIVLMAFFQGTNTN